MSKFAHKVCPYCLHKNYFVRLEACPNCDQLYPPPEPLVQAFEELKAALCERFNFIFKFIDWLNAKLSK